MTVAQDGTNVTPEEIAAFRDGLRHGLDAVAGFDATEVIVGLPFADDDDTVAAVIETAQRGLAQMGLDRKSLVLCVGAHDRRKPLETDAARNKPTRS